MREIRTHLTYANVMSTLAVFLLFGGASAYAAKKQTQKIGTTQIKASAVTTAKIKNKAVDASKLKDAAVTNTKIAGAAVTNTKIAGDAVTNTKIAGDAVTGDKVNEASLSEVPSANSANPTAFAKVNSNGTVDGANSKGITSVNVSKPPLEFGVYCISLAAFAPRGGQVTTERSGGAATTGALAIGGGPSCPSPRIEVETFVNNVAGDVGFYLELYR